MQIMLELMIAGVLAEGNHARWGNDSMVVEASARDSH